MSMKLIEKIKEIIQSKEKMVSEKSEFSDVFEAAPQKNWIIYLKKPHQYTSYNMLFDEAQRKHPKSIRTLNKGKIIWSQDKPFTEEQIDEVKTSGFHYQWGFGPCYEKIPYEKIKMSKLTNKEYEHN